MKNKTIKSAVAAILAVFVLLFAVACTTSTPTPTPEPTPTPIDETAFHVATNGNDESDGTINAPFATVDKAISAVKDVIADGLTKPVTVYVHGGDYFVETIDLSGIKGTAEYPVTFKAYNGEEVILNGGITITLDDFTDITDNDVLARIADSAKGKVKVCDLAKFGITRKMLGELYPTGFESTIYVQEYYHETMGTNAEFFWNDERMHLARYPETGYLYSTGLVDSGNIKECIGGTMIVDKSVTDRMSTWQELDEVYMYSCPMFTWSELVTKLTNVDFDNGYIQAKYCSTNGYKEEEIPFYFYNVLEELDNPGEYYIDRENLLLYFYPDATTGTVGAIAISNKTLLQSKDIEHITVEGITFKASRSNGFHLSECNYFTFKNCKFTCLNSAGSITGYNNLIYGCEASTLGRMGFDVFGGDRATLTPGNNVVENCFIHDFAQVYTTYQQAVFLHDCGNKMIHCEVSNSPHLAVSYTGNDHLMEYNYIHDVVLNSQDSGALYSGGDWSSCGVVIRYNFFRNIGRNGGDCKAIYFDDGMSSGTIYGNIVENCTGRAINIGGGRDVVVENNLVISDGEVFSYDARLGTSGDVNNSWASIYWKIEPGTGIWKTLANVPYLSDIWVERYPNLALITTDYSRYRDPEFPGNPAYSIVKNNIFIGKKAMDYENNIDADVYEYSEIGFNATSTKRSDFLEDGSYSIMENRLAMYKGLYGLEFEQIPYEQIGRYGVGING